MTGEASPCGLVSLGAIAQGAMLPVEARMTGEASPCGLVSLRATAQAAMLPVEVAR
jgi:hypothetical protein